MSRSPKSKTKPKARPKADRQPRLVPPAPPASKPAPLPRTIVYIDAFNLYYGCLKHTPYRWLNIEEMCRLLLPNNQVLAIKYFTARIRPPANDPDKAVRQEVYLRALSTLPLVSITYGQYLSHTVKRPLASPPPPNSPLAGILVPGTSSLVEVVDSEEKGSDVNIATHMVLDAAKDALDVAVLISNDSDLQEPLRVVREELGKAVGLIAPLNSERHPSRQLQQYASFTRQIRGHILKASQFPATLTDSRGEIHQPPNWTHK